MSHAVEQMAFSGALPWHGLGVAVNNDLTPKQMLKAAGLDWKVEKRKKFFQKEDGEFVEIPGAMALVRDKDGQLMTEVSERYKPIQNEEALEFFREFVTAGSMTMETAGSLWKGRWIWALARVSKDAFIDKGKKDAVSPFVLLAAPHIVGKAAVAQFTPIRVVCANTITAALGSGLKGKIGAVRFNHSQKFDEKAKDSAKIALGLATKQFEEFMDAGKFLASKKASAEISEEFFCRVLSFDPKEAAKLKDGETIREPIQLGKFREALLHSPGADLGSAKGTFWGLLNAVTFTVDHDTGRGEQSTRLKNAWFGHQAGVKRDALKLALEMAK